MAFAGKWEVESQEGYEEFCKLLGETETKAATSCITLFLRLVTEASLLFVSTK